MNDFIQINDINIFTPDSLMSGTWSANVPYARPLTMKMTDDVNNIERGSPMCAHATTMGAGTIQICNPAPPTCDLGRSLLPGRDIEDGLWSLDPTTGRIEPEIKQSDALFFIVLALIALGIVLLLRLTSCD